MKTIIIIVLFLISFNIYAQNKYNIAVMELDGNNVSKGDLGGLSNRLRTELFNTGKFNVIERSRVDEILKEQGFQQTGCTNTECAVEIGRLIGVEKIVVGSVDKVGTIYISDIRLVDVETGKIENTATIDCEDCSINDVLKRSIRSVTHKLVSLESENPKIISKSTNYQNSNFHFEDKPFYILPRIGISTFTGIAGLEIQIKSISFNFGLIPSTPDGNGIASGIKYYIKPHQKSWFIGIGGIRFSEDHSDEKLPFDKSWDMVKKVRILLGLTCGYQWQWPSGLDVCFGLGIGYMKFHGEKKFNYDEFGYEYFVNDEKTEVNSSVIPMFEISVGYSF